MPIAGGLMTLAARSMIMSGKPAPEMTEEI